MNENTDYLKKYVKNHPHNKMAWYLLGRVYAAKGEEKKALYCYRKSEDVYAAFEQRENPAIQKVLSKHEKLSEADAPTRPKGWRRVLIFIALLLLVGIPLQSDGIFYDKTSISDEMSLDETPRIVKDESPETALAENPIDSPIDVQTDETQYTRIYYMLMERDEIERHSLLQETLGFPLTIDAKTRIVVAQAIPLQNENDTDMKSRWYSWTSEPNFLFTVDHEPFKGSSHIEYLDEAWCHCEPQSPIRAKAEFTAWQTSQMNEWILLQAVQSFIERHGRSPDNIAQLALDYPNNMISGYTDEMEEQFQQIHEYIVHEQLGSVDVFDLSVAYDSSDVRLSGRLFPGKTSSEQPLEVIIDRTNHRLAVVHGNMIVRNYEVGLGGERTPLGQFEVTEKVRNPNGRPDGEFGSRGMTLSDTLYAIHGTNDPDSIGKDESLGCIRMLAEDIEELFDMIPLGTRVTIADYVLPDELIVPEKRFHLPVISDETNDEKVYRWLN